MATISNKLSIGSVAMVKWFILFGGIVLLGINFYAVYDVYQPKVGPIGSGRIPMYFWVSIFISTLSGIIAIAQFLYYLPTINVIKIFLEWKRNGLYCAK